MRIKNKNVSLDELERYKLTFGHDFQLDENDDPIEKGIGSNLQRAQLEQKMKDQMTHNLKLPFEVQLKFLAPARGTLRLDQKKVDGFRRKLRGGGTFPPIIVTVKSRTIPGYFEVVEGSHRIEAARQEARATITARMQQ